jgi:glycosyltransferase involved in cell wall biosynthesis
VNTAAAQHCYEINLQPGMGGGEIYTRFFTQALVALGCRVSLIALRGSWLAQHLRMEGVQIVEVDRQEDIPGRLAADGSPAFSHHPLSGPVAAAIRQGHRLLYFAHMPLYGRKPAPLQSCDLILAVSQHVIDSLRAAGLTHYHPEPLYGVADLQRGAAGDGEIRSGQVYDWDRRKLRDRLLSWVHPLLRRCMPARVYAKRPGLTLGIVSRLTPIKQFPLLFATLAPILARHPTVNLEIFGSGGYASVRDLRRALAPARKQVRFWGHQADVRRIYAQVDYLMAGLPEKEALGLNVIEAEMCGTPVLAPNAPPFTETVSQKKTGFLYTDPRQDQGRDFERLLLRLLESKRPQPLDHPEWLERFSPAAFRERVARLLLALNASHA